ncbi:MAG: response regulator transcription factor, partial [Rhodobacterales bacterium]|nr:response regulator transcription factor [Rhodobacterales bacterium]
MADLGAEVRTVADADAALRSIQAEGPFSVILLDINMAGMNGTESVRKIAAANQPGNVVIFSGIANEDFVARAIEAGARGHIPKTQPLASLPDAIRLIASGTVFVPFTNRSVQRERAPG